MEETYGIYHIASSLGVFGTVKQGKIPPKGDQQELIELFLGVKGAIYYPSSIDSPRGSALSSKQIKKIQFSLLLFFANKITKEMLEKQIVKYAQAPQQDRVLPKDEQRLLEMTETLLKIGRILDNFQQEDLVQWKNEIQEYSIQSLVDLWTCFYSLFEQVPNKEQFSIEHILDNKMGTNPFHHKPGRFIETLTNAQKLLDECNAESTAKCSLNRKFAGRAQEDDQSKPDVLIEAEKVVVNSLNRLYDAIVITKSLVHSKIIQPMF